MAVSTSSGVTVSGAGSEGEGGGGSCSSSGAAGCLSCSAAMTSVSGSTKVSSEVSILSAARMSPSAHFPRIRRARASSVVFCCRPRAASAERSVGKGVWFGIGVWLFPASCRLIYAGAVIPASSLLGARKVKYANARKFHHTWTV